MAESVTNSKIARAAGGIAPRARRRRQQRPRLADGQAVGIRRRQNSALVVDFFPAGGVLRDGGFADVLFYQVTPASASGATIIR
jgi:predicted sugar kinase